MEPFAKYRKLVLAVSCEAMGFLGLLTLLVLSVDDTNYAGPAHLWGFLSYYNLTPFFFVFLLLLLAGLGILLLPALKSWKGKDFKLFYKDRTIL